MADENEKLLMTLLKKSGNSVCADCNSKCEFLRTEFPKLYFSSQFLISNG